MAIHQFKSASSAHSYKFRATLPVPLLMDAVPLRGPAERRTLEERQPGKGNVTKPGWLGYEPERKQGMIRNVRPDREIQHTSERSVARSTTPFIRPRQPSSRPLPILEAITFSAALSCPCDCRYTHSFIVLSILSPVPTIGNGQHFFFFLGNARYR